MRQVEVRKGDGSARAARCGSWHAGEMLEQAPVDLDLIEAHAGGVGDADVIFVFGTLHPTPAHVAAHHYHGG